MGWYWYNYQTHQWWVSMVIHDWDGGLHVTDDFGNLVAV